MTIAREQAGKERGVSSWRTLGLHLTLGALAGTLALSGLTAPLERPLSDAMLRLASRFAPATPATLPDVAIVAIDARSLRAFPQWPWSRTLYARAIEHLEEAGARAVAFDIDFSTPRPEEDAVLGFAVAHSSRVALAAFRQFQDLPEVGELEVVSWPTDTLSAGAAAVGHVVVPVDSDGVVRDAPRALSLGGRRVASLSAALLALSSGTVPEAEPSLGRFAIDYRRTNPPVPVVSIADLLEDRFDASAVAGRAVLIGATAVEFQDLWATPHGPARPGVWIQALVYRTLAAERAGQATLRALPSWASVGLLALLSAFAGALSRADTRRRAAVLGALGLGWVGASFAALVALGWLMAPGTPLAVVGVHYALGLEGVQRRLGRRLAERELSLSTLFEVGESASHPSSESGLGVGLLLLGQVLRASGVSLLRATPAGRLDGIRLDWNGTPEGETVRHEVGDLDTAQQVLLRRRIRVFEGRIPGSSAAGIAVYAPLLVGEVPVGVLVVECEGGHVLDEVQLRTIATVGAQLALSARNMRLVEDLRATLRASVEAIASAVEARDGYTEMHCRRLALFSVTMARHLDLPDEELEAIRLGALLHDVGKIGIRDEILLKPGRFDAEERRIMEGHAVIGHRIISPIQGLRETTLACVRSHHEKWDGSGYPDRTAGLDIPLGARIVSIVDVWDALSTVRPYKGALPQDQVRAELEKGRGSHFDPDLLDLFFRVLADEGEDMLTLISQSVRP